MNSNNFTGRYAVSITEILIKPKEGIVLKTIHYNDGSKEEVEVYKYPSPFPILITID